MAFFDKDKAKNLFDSARQKAEEALNNVDKEKLKDFAVKTTKALTDASAVAAKAAADVAPVVAKYAKDASTVVANTAVKTGTAVADAAKTAAPIVAQKTTELVSLAGEKAVNMKEQLIEMKEQIQEGGYSEKAFEVTQDLITTLAKVPLVRVDREEFLNKVFSNSPYLEQILDYGPQSVFTSDSLRKKAEDIIKNSTRKTAVVSFAAGLASNPFAMAVTIPADITQFFAFALNLAQKIAYLFGEDELFKTFDPTDDLIKSDGSVVPEDAQIRMISYLGSMLGVSGASSLIVQTSKTAGANIGKKVAAQALTKTTWYPIVKKVGSILGYKVTKKTVEEVISKSVPLIGGFISGSLTYFTFKPLGGRLADVFVKLLNGDFDIEMELNPEFKKTLGTSDEDLDSDIIEGDFVDIEQEVEDEEYLSSVAKEEE